MAKLLGFDALGPHHFGTERPVEKLVLSRQGVLLVVSCATKMISKAM